MCQAHRVRHTSLARSTCDPVDRADVGYGHGRSVSGRGGEFHGHRHRHAVVRDRSRSRPCRRADRAVQKATRDDEPGCLAYCFAADPVEPTHVQVYELWTDPENLARHFDHPNYAAMVERAPELRRLRQVREPAVGGRGSRSGVRRRSVPVRRGGRRRELTRPRCRVRVLDGHPRGASARGSRTFRGPAGRPRPIRWSDRRRPRGCDR